MNGHSAEGIAATSPTDEEVEQLMSEDIDKYLADSSHIAPAEPNYSNRGLELLREPFPKHQVNKLPRRTCPKDEWEKLPKARCTECGGWHASSKTIHLSYVGHAALTDRLLDADPYWTWEPFATDGGLPKFDATGGLWIKLTVCGVTRMGYGHAAGSDYKDPGAREKEVIGDALRNAAMRFGAALELWHKGDLHDPKEAIIFGVPNPPKPKLSVDQENTVHSKTLAYLESGDGNAIKALWKDYGPEEQTSLWTLFDSKQRAAIKKLVEKDKANA